MRKTDNVTMTFDELDDSLSSVWGIIRDYKEAAIIQLEKAQQTVGKTLIEKDNDPEEPEVVKAIAIAKNIQEQIDTYTKLEKEASAKIHEIIRDFEARETEKQKQGKE